MKDDTATWEKFLFALEWVLAMQARYATSVRHSLVCIRFHNQKALGDTYGAKMALQMVADLAKQLRQAMRKTDLIARDGTRIWVLIPFVTPESVLSKVSQMVEIAAENGLDIVDRDLSVFSIPDADILDELAFTNAQDFLDAIASKKSVAMRWEGVLRHDD